MLHFKNKIFYLLDKVVSCYLDVRNKELNQLPNTEEHNDEALDSSDITVVLNGFKSLDNTF